MAEQPADLIQRASADDHKSEDSAMVDGLGDAVAGAVMLVMTGAKAQSHPARPTPSITTPAAHANMAVGIMQNPRRCSNRTSRRPSLKKL